MEVIQQVISAIEHELEKSSKESWFKVVSSRPEGTLWRVRVDSEARGQGLDESMEEAVAWWLGPPKGAADVLAVLPEEQEIVLRYVTSSPPGPGSMMALYPPRYLEALLSAWKEKPWATSCLRLQASLRDSRANPDESQVPPLLAFETILRERQRRAALLLGHDVGFLQGPPGTGKTFTLGVLVAMYLLARAGRRVLLLSTTNLATDIALIKVDEALRTVETKDLPTQALRKSCKRVGNHFVASQYTGRAHLLPEIDHAIFKRLLALESLRPDRQEIQAYATWRRQVEELRAEIRRRARNDLREHALIAMTTTLAAFLLPSLREAAPFDAVVFDEASQVSQAHALALMPLGRRVLFAGDPAQLAPIACSDLSEVMTWIGSSTFDYMKKGRPNTCTLNEQSRMIEPICQVVSSVFYDHELIVAKEKASDVAWHAERSVDCAPLVGDRHVHLESVKASPVWSHKFRGPIRYESATQVLNIIKGLTPPLPAEKIVVLTPFRAQRTLIKNLLSNAELRKVEVSTVHRAQGTERHTVLFDPVDGASKFLMERGLGLRLTNVALSRAMARLVVFLSDGDRKNPVLSQLATAIEKGLGSHAASGIEEVIFAPGFPEAFVGKPLVIDEVGEIEDVLGDARIRFRVYSSGRLKTYDLGFLKRKCSEADYEKQPVAGAPPDGAVEPEDLSPLPKDDLRTSASIPSDVAGPTPTPPRWADQLVCRKLQELERSLQSPRCGKCGRDATLQARDTGIVVVCGDIDCGEAHRVETGLLQRLADSLRIPCHNCKQPALIARESDWVQGRVSHLKCRSCGSNKRWQYVNDDLERVTQV